MSGHKPFKNLSDALRATPEGRTAIARHEAILRDMLALYKQREARGVAHIELDKAWNTSQTNVSGDEQDRDMYLSTLRAYIAALGGHLELRAVFPDQAITLEGPSTAAPDVAAPPDSTSPSARSGEFV